ncbi:MAG: hypothetical protein K8I01_12955 [Candidatus Methylomirabilis sp.]|nr:hypothetical protein [Deltaproteobacteria bacterium]
MKRTVSALLAALVLFLAVAPAQAASTMEKGEPTSSEIIFDVLVGRPLGIVATVLGTAVFIVGLPFTIPARSVGVTAEKLIADPFKYTFARPVGDIDSYARYCCDDTKEALTGPEPSAL